MVRYPRLRATVPVMYKSSPARKRPSESVSAPSGSVGSAGMEIAGIEARVCGAR
jgi:hypothetical protein